MYLSVEGDLYHNQLSKMTLCFGYFLMSFTVCGELVLAGRPLPTKADLSLSFPSWTRDRKYSKKLVG